MIDAHSALRLHLLESSPLRTMVGVHIYWPDDLPIHRYTVNFRCYGTSAYDAYTVYRALHDRLVRSGPLIVTETFATPDERVAFYNFAEVTPGQPLQEPSTDWFYVFSVWQATVATTAIAAA
jgi:hypothetical protein